jgi:hypothetical protein
MPYTIEWYKRRIEITKSRATGETCGVCQCEIVLDTIVWVRFCRCGYRQHEGYEFSDI